MSRKEKIAIGIPLDLLSTLNQYSADHGITIEEAAEFCLRQFLSDGPDKNVHPAPSSLAQKIQSLASLPDDSPEFGHGVPVPYGSSFPVTDEPTINLRDSAGYLVAWWNPDSRAVDIFESSYLWMINSSGWNNQSPENSLAFAFERDPEAAALNDLIELGASEGFRLIWTPHERVDESSLPF